MAERLRMRPAQRLRTRSDFQRVRQSRLKASNEYLLVYAAPNELGRTRLGVAVNRRLGNAPARNRQKRLLREAFRLSQHELPDGLDLLCIVLRIEDAGLDDYRAWLAELAAQAVRQEKSRPRKKREGRSGSG